MSRADGQTKVSWDVVAEKVEGRDKLVSMDVSWRLC
jgi:hypothetical protein